MKIKEEEMIKMLLNGMPRDILINTNYTLYKDSNMKDLEIKQLQERIDKAIEYINEMTLTSDGYANYGDDLRPEHIVDILKGEQ